MRRHRRPGPRRRPGQLQPDATAAAQALVDWLATDPTGSGDPDFLIIGDLNSYAMERSDRRDQGRRRRHAGTGDDYTNLDRRVPRHVRLLVRRSTARPATSTTRSRARPSPPRSPAPPSGTSTPTSPTSSTTTRASSRRPRRRCTSRTPTARPTTTRRRRPGPERAAGALDRRLELLAQGGRRLVPGRRE